MGGAEDNVEFFAEIPSPLPGGAGGGGGGGDAANGMDGGGGSGSHARGPDGGGVPDGGRGGGVGVDAAAAGDMTARVDTSAVTSDGGAEGSVVGGLMTGVAPSGGGGGGGTARGTKKRTGVRRVVAVLRDRRADVAKLLSETRIANVGARLPTQREAVLFLWETTLVVALLALLRSGVHRILRWIHTRLEATRPSGARVPYETSVFECMQRPLEFLAIFTVGASTAEALSRPLAATGLLRYIRAVRELGIIFAATWFLLRWIDRIRARFAADKRVDKAQVAAISRMATVGTAATAILISLDTLGINIQTVLAFGGIGGVAIGFAGRDVISNVFSGFMIYATRPFTVGEWVRSIEAGTPGVDGTVEHIGWYLTRIRTWDKRPLYIPNSRFSTMILENPSRMSNRRVLHTLHLRIEDMGAVRTVLASIQNMLQQHPDLDPRQHRMVYIDSFDTFSVCIWLSCYTKSVFLYDFRRVQQDVLLQAYDIVRSCGARLATVTTRDMRDGTDPDRAQRRRSDGEAR
ncbi:hypothetical protein I4F81_007191 [Pyropia yezoensis]|uniref:Uncharacterized protein n=1 Tax=Pyropia yezoensis TaxID=2788 RepID=A0ACC3C3B7_PYRYE|nr:hypothetical protein I4F81_007191 [Neopyropia yezoensis]